MEFQLTGIVMIMNYQNDYYLSYYPINLNWKTAMKLYTKKEAAAILRISQPTLDRYVADGNIDSTKIGRKRIFFDSHLEKFIKKNEVINY